MFNPDSMIVGVDLDAVCANYYAGLRSFLQRSKGYTDEEVAQHYPDPEYYNMTTWTGFPETFLDEHRDAVADGLYLKMPVIEGASETLWQLNEEGYHLRIITSRFVSHGQHATVIGDTAKWLDKNSIPYRDIMFVRNKTDVFADVYIDDAPENIVNFQSANRDVIIFDTLYNKDLPGLHARSWSEVYSHITELKAQKTLSRK